MAILNKAQLQSESDSTYINNNGNLINPQAVRAFNDDLIDSVIVADQTGSMSVATASFVVSASYAQTASVLLGSVASASYAATASVLLGTVVSASFAVSASVAENAYTASYVVTALTASYVVTAQTASFVSGSNVKGTVSSSFTASIANTATTASYVLNAQSSSRAVSASRADSAATAATASYVVTALTASYVQTAQTASYVLNAVSSSRAVSASRADSSVTAVTASYVLNAVSSSYAANADLLDGKDSSIFATTGSNLFVGQQTINGNLIVSGNLYVSGSEVVVSSSILVVGDRIIELNANRTVGDAGIYVYDVVAPEGTGSLLWNATGNYWMGGFAGSEIKFVRDNDTGSMSVLSASFATSASTAVSANSATTASYVLNAVSASFATTALSASYAPAAAPIATGSFATTGSNTFIGNQTISGSVNISGSIVMQNGQDIITHHVKALAVNGVEIQNNTGGVVGLFGAGGALGTTFYGQVNATAFQGSGSGIVGVVTASFATTASYALNIPVTSSYAVSASRAVSAESATSSSFAETASFATTALSASYAPGAAAIDTGSFATTGSNTFIGNQKISGSLNVASSLGGINKFASSSIYLEATSLTSSILSLSPYINEYSSSATSTTGGNLFRGHTFANSTASFVISGSNNIISLTAAGLNVQTTGNTLWGFTGVNNEIKGLPRATGSGASSASAVLPSINTSYVVAGPIVTNLDPNRTTNGSVSISNSIVLNSLSANMSSGSLSTSTNIILQGITANVSGSATNQIIGNVANVGSFLVSLHGSGSGGILGYNILSGTNHQILVSGSGTSIALANSLIVGAGLIVTGSTSGSGTTFGMSVLGRNNAQTSSAGTPLNDNAQTIVAIGTGTSTSARRTSFHISSSGLTQVFDGLQVSGSATFNGGVTGSLEGTASFAISSSRAVSASIADSALTASFVANAQTASFVLNAVSASFATTALSASYAPGGASIATGSFATTGSNTFNGAQTITGSVNGNVTALSISSNTASLNLNNGNFFTLTLVSGSNTAISASNIKPGQTVNLRVKQPSPGFGTLTLPISFAQVSGSSYTATPTASAEDIITLVSFDSSTLYLASVKNLITPPTFISANGGTITTSGSFKIHTFTASANFTISSLGNDPIYGSNIEVLAVAGGGGGGSGHAGGGGAGGLIYSASYAVTATTYTASIGAGGNGAVDPNKGTNGGNTSFGSLTADGGGAGGIGYQGATKRSGSNGGSGGGNATGGSVTPGQGTSGQGYNGGSGTAEDGAGGGGGGAGMVGYNAVGTGFNANTPGNGGDGLQYSISGTATYYAGGGGGGGYRTNNYQSTGGLGGGGNGKTNSTGVGNTGSANTGGGGGGGGWDFGGGGAGGSGIVIVKYKYQ